MKDTDDGHPYAKFYMYYFDIHVVWRNVIVINKENQQ